MQDGLLEVAPERLLWILIWDVYVKLQGLSAVRTFFWRLKKHRDLLNVLEIVEQNLVKALEQFWVLFQGQAATMRAPAHVAAWSILD